jgi:hypothetical protein
MNIRKSKYWYFFALVFFLLAIFSQSCVDENIEEKFFSESVAAKEYYAINVLPILNSKCFSCHTYHNSSGTRYDTYAKAAAVAEEMANRTSSQNPNIVMPPPSAEPLTKEEIKVIQQFYQRIKGSGENSIETAGGDSNNYGVTVSWTAYKFPVFSSRVGVSGTFEETFITYKKKEAADIYEYLREAEILISTNSANIGNDPLKTSNVVNHFFSNFTPAIHGRLIDIDTSSNKAKVKFTINGLSQEIIFQMEEVEEDLVFTGKMQDIGYFKANAALDALQQVCGEYHQDKVWPDISLRAEIKNFRKFAESFD